MIRTRYVLFLLALVAIGGCQPHLRQQVKTIEVPPEMDNAAAIA